MKLPTARQLEVLSAIAEFQAKHGFPPTFREMMKAVGCVSPTVIYHCNGYGHIQCLERKGCVEIDRVKRDQRGLRITDLGYYFLGLPAARVIVPKASTKPSNGTVDLGQRCQRCEAQLFGGVHLCREHRRAA